MAYDAESWRVDVLLVIRREPPLGPAVVFVSTVMGTDLRAVKI